METATVERQCGYDAIEVNAHSLTVEPDIQLMCRVRDGDSHSYTMLLDRYRKPLISFLFRIVQNQCVAEELSQEVFLRVYRSRERYEPTAKFTTWLFRIASHVAINWLRDGRREHINERLDHESSTGILRQFPDCKPTAEQSLLALARAQEIRNAIASLPENQRAAVIMHKYKGFDYGQIATALECSDSAVKSLLFRAYGRLRGLLAHFSD